MKEILLSDWTLVAFKQREEERRRKEQGEPALAPPNEEMQRNNETLRSDWTIAALQKRFSALEQRLAALEDREEEQRRKERAEAARVPPGEEKQRSEEVFLSNLTLVAPKQRNEERRTNEQPEFAEAKFEHEQVEATHRANEQRLQREEAETVRRDEQEGLQRDRIEIRLVRNGETVHAGAAQRMVRGFFSVLITAFIAGAIGFGAGIYVVPIEKATHFRALVKRGLDQIYGDHSPQEK